MHLPAAGAIWKILKLKWMNEPIHILSFFKRIAKTILFVFLFCMANIVAGLYFRLGIVQGAFTFGNIIYYVLAFLSFLLLIRSIVKTWKN